MKRWGEEAVFPSRGCGWNIEVGCGCVMGVSESCLGIEKVPPLRMLKPIAIDPTDRRAQNRGTTHGTKQWELC